MALDPWSYADKSGTEHAHQTALFMWANMVRRFGLQIANDPLAYTKLDYANQRSLELGGAAYAVPQLKWLHAIHNQGHGDAIRGGKAKAEGVKAGVADLFLPVAVRNTGLISPNYYQYYHGYYLELKVGKNTPSEKQLEFIADMRAAGYAADWCIGWLDARQLILDYLQIPT